MRPLQTTDGRTTTMVIARTLLKHSRLIKYRVFKRLVDGRYSVFDVQKDSRYGGRRRGCARAERLQVYGRAIDSRSVRLHSIYKHLHLSRTWPPRNPTLYLHKRNFKHVTQLYTTFPVEQRLKDKKKWCQPANCNQDKVIWKALTNTLTRTHLAYSMKEIGTVTVARSTYLKKCTSVDAIGNQVTVRARIF